ncbi:hypothetical protein CISG_08035 [Coccidioides immitis RMSCC 3703]|uniref:Uncharacterized protein n=1 Tax=Coccidioides immitis RMSCC 3703 TaxID=454286 RepID=A0A0J8R5Q9_COCIT|nr:hypothetical protein CISG_08035 [Coccidioides immitis RMSCC 3703]
MLQPNGWLLSEPSTAKDDGTTKLSTSSRCNPCPVLRTPYPVETGYGIASLVWRMLLRAGRRNECSSTPACVFENWHSMKPRSEAFLESRELAAGPSAIDTNAGSQRMYSAVNVLAFVNIDEPCCIVRPNDLAA